MDESAPQAVSETKEKLSLNFLAADDSPVNRAMFKEILGYFGHKFKIVEDGDQLLAELSNEGEIYDIVLSDNQMPGRNGVEVLEAIRKIEKFKTLPFIIATTDTEGSLGEKIDALGGFFLPKPFSVKQLSDAIKKVTEDKV